MTREATVERNTKETKIAIKLNLDGTGKSSLDTGVGFFNHMLDGFTRHGLFDLEIKVKGDLQVDDHHTIEDTGIVLGTAIKEAVGDNTIIMSLMNGVDSEEIISEKVDASHILHSLIKVASHKEGTGYCFDPETTIGIIFGEISAPFESERVEEIKELFADTGLHFRATEYIREEMWSKYRLNICNNLPQAILGAGVGCYSDSTHMKAISDGLKKEVEAVAAAKGIDMSKVDIKSARGSAVPPTARYSTLQDIDAGRHTEIDMFSGALVRMGKELGVPTPYNEYTYHMIKALEEKNDGLFDYDGKNAETTCAK